MPALDDIVVLDFSIGKAGAICSMLLSDNGARVIRIAEVSQLVRMHPEFAALDRGKELRQIDLPKDEDELISIVDSADVIVEDFVPNDPRQSYFDFESRRSSNSDLIHCSITAYGRHGPLSNEPAIAGLVKARIGIYDENPGFRDGSIYVIHPFVDLGAGLLAAQGVVSSLIGRLVNGRGAWFETSLMAGGLLFAPKASHPNIKPRPFPPNALGGGPFYSVFECEDGKWLQLACVHGGFIDRAAAVMGIADVLTDSRFGDGRFPVDAEAREELFQIIKNRIKFRPYHEWEEIFRESDIPFALVCTADEALNNEQVIHNEMVHSLVDPILGSMDQFGLPIKFSKTPGMIRGPRNIIPDENTEIARKCRDSIVTPNSASELPLKGIKIADITNVVAGPVACRLLADLGAEVIKIEPLFGDISRAGGLSFFHALNCNKKSIAINAKDALAQRALQKVVSKCDVLLSNLRPGVTARMGLGDDFVQQFCPDIIQTRITAFGWDGPWSDRPGMDPLAQASMGLLRAQGGIGNPPSILTYLAATDYTAGGLAALGTLMAIFSKKMTGYSQIVQTNLLNAATMLMDGDFARYSGKFSRQLVDKGQHGLSIGDRLYETLDGWIYLSCEESSKVEKVIFGLSGSLRNKASDFVTSASQEVALQQCIALRESTFWLEVFAENGIPCAPSVEDYYWGFFDDPQAIFNGMVKRFGSIEGDEFLVSGGLIDFSDIDQDSGIPTPDLGQHTIDILKESGVDETDISDLLESGAIIDNGS